jgi:hypothetical protein
MTREVKLSVNDAPISLDYFVQGFIDHTLGGVSAALEGTGEIETLEVDIEGDQVSFQLNSGLVPVNTFVSKIVRSTIVGMLSALKGVDRIDRVAVSIRR